MYSHASLSNMPTQSDKARILVLGDTSVGKTCMTHLICYNEKLTHPPTHTVGCNAEVKLHSYNQRPYFIEFMDVGGSTKYEKSRLIFYTPINGLILVHDLTNKKSYTNLQKWINELLRSKGSNLSWTLKSEQQTLIGGIVQNILELEHDEKVGTSIPVLVIGNKADLIKAEDYSSYLSMDQLGRDTLIVSSINTKSFEKSTLNSNKLEAFLNRCLERSLSTVGYSGRTDRLSYKPMSPLPTLTDIQTTTNYIQDDYQQPKESTGSITPPPQRAHNSPSRAKSGSFSMGTHSLLRFKPAPTIVAQSPPLPNSYPNPSSNNVVKLTPGTPVLYNSDDEGHRRLSIG